jgi:hypothetical protein
LVVGEFTSTFSCQGFLSSRDQFLWFLDAETDILPADYRSSSMFSILFCTKALFRALLLNRALQSPGHDWGDYWQLLVLARLFF